MTNNSLPGVPRTRPLVAGAVALMAAMATAIGAAPASATSRPAGRQAPAEGDGTYTFAVIGDIPYGDLQIAQFPKVVDQINADPDVRLVDHLGDIKSGSSPCTDEYNTAIRTQFDRFADPLVYTPGDNEWTDCHRPEAGGYDPLERLGAVRSTFFDQPGRTLGQHAVRVKAQGAQGYPENVRYRRERVSFGAMHVVGSNNGLAPWTGRTAATPEQTAEVLGRTAAAVRLVQDTFDDARAHRDRAVVLLTQADMFDPTEADPQYPDHYAFTPVVREVARQAAAFKRPVYLINGDSHLYNADQPLAAGSPWLGFYGVPAPAGNLRRITVDGSTEVADWLKVTVDPRDPAVLRWARVPFTG
jgi:Calcineurin-like phosphoesterase